MIDKMKKNNTLLIIIISVLHWMVTFFTDRIIFVVSPMTNLSDYIICKVLLLFVLLYIYRTLYRLFLAPDKKTCCEKKILQYALIYLIPVILILLIKIPHGFISNDESLIYTTAINLTHDTWFNYMTTYYYIVCLMLIPSWCAPILIKAAIQTLIAGYFIYRLSKVITFKYAKFGYILFLLYPVIAYTASAHRLPVYYLLYLLFLIILLFDHMEKNELTRTKGVLLILIGAVLTQWRTEGIYLAVLVPILLLIVYRNLRTRQAIIKLLLSFILIQYIISIPQTGFFAKEVNAAADDRMKPFYAYTITNMYRNGLDLEKNKADLEIVDHYLSISAIESINDYYGDINYEDVLILYKEGYIGVRPEATVADFFAYSAALKRIFINNPDVFIKTRIGAFQYAALPFHITFTGFSIKPLISFAISIVKTISYNLFIPLTIVFVLCLYTLIRKRWFTFFVMGGMIAHWFIVFILAPASYFKYYFPVYMIAYFYIIMLAFQFFYNRTHDDKLEVLK